MPIAGMNLGGEFRELVSQQPTEPFGSVFKNEGRLQGVNAPTRWDDNIRCPD
jgi:hypothetical protein